MQREQIIYMEKTVSNNGKYDDQSFSQCGEVLQHVQVQPHKEMKFNAKYDSSSWSHDPLKEEMNPMNEEIEDHVRFRKLYKTLQENDWKGVEGFTTSNPDALTAKIRVLWRETLFHIITRKLGTPNWLIKKLVSKVPPEQFEQLTDRYGGTALFCAASFGNKQAAEAFVGRNKKLPNFRNNNGLLPIHRAAACGHKEMIQYLLKVTTVPLNDDKGVELLKSLISSATYGSAYDLLKIYPGLISKTEDRGSILEALANKPLAFQSGSRFGYWRRLIYNWIPLPEKHIHYPEKGHGDEEKQIEGSKKCKQFTYFGSIRRQIFTVFGASGQRLHIMLWNALTHLVPGIKNIRDTKLMHMQTLEIVKMMCHKGVIWSSKEAYQSLRNPILTAARLGICEIVGEILKAYFYSYALANKNRQTIFDIAILHRQDKVFSLVKKMDLLLYEWKAANLYETAENILHLTAKTVISSQVSGAALQMQRELQWFKAVESYVHPSLQEQRNEYGETPREVFTKQHEGLVEKGEKWMKETASSCSVVAALIITVVFAAAFTVPGGNKEDGTPIFAQSKAFIMFAVSDALALFSSISSVLMFLAILTSRYSEDDFLESLPKKLIVGLVTLFFSIANMMLAFGATFYIALSSPWKWVIIPIASGGCLPVILFVWLQFPLMIEICSSTFWPIIS